MRVRPGSAGTPRARPKSGRAPTRARRGWIVASFALAALAGCARVSGAPLPAPSVTAGIDFVLAPGETGRFGAAPEKLVRFVRVVEDGRCPRQVNCAVSGPVTVEVEVGAASHLRTERLAVLDRDVGEPRFPGIHSCATLVGDEPGTLDPLATDSPRRAKVRPRAVLRLRDVQPWPVRGTPIPPDRYRATFVVGPSCARAAPPNPGAPH
jgi:hypothetical protein